MRDGLRAFFVASLLSLALASAASGSVAFSVTTGEPARGQRVGSDRFTVGGTEIACDEVTFSVVPGGNSKSLALEPAYGECLAKTLTGLPADFYQELCDFVLRDVERLGGTNRWMADVDIECRGQWNAVGWDFYETESKYSLGQALCGIRIPEQAGAGTAVVSNIEGRRPGIEIHWELDDFEYEVFRPSLLCGSITGAEQEDASYKGSAVIEGAEIVSGER
jgi:hypothetical protein